jgi:hypothetical protein
MIAVAPTTADATDRHPRENGVVSRERFELST